MHSFSNGHAPKIIAHYPNCTCIASFGRVFFKLQRLYFSFHTTKVLNPVSPIKTEAAAKRFTGTKKGAEIFRPLSANYFFSSLI